MTITARRSILYDVYEKLTVERVAHFFTRDEKNWSAYLQRQDVFTPKAYAELQEQQQAILTELLVTYET